MTEPLKAPYPYFGGKSRIASDIWQRFGDVPNYIEPFFGSGAVLLARPTEPGLELVNDIDGYVVNFWRAVQADADAVAEHADYPAFESDLHARHVWLVERRDDLQARLEGDPDYYDAKIAGWWVWGMSLWIGSGFCSGRGSWVSVDGELVNAKAERGGVARQLPRVVDRSLRSDFVENYGATGGRHRQLPRPVSAGGVGCLPRDARQTPVLTVQQGIRRKMPEVESARGDTARRAGLLAYMRDLQQRFSRVRVTCGDWTRVVSPAVLNAKTPTAVLLDPPYTGDGRESGLYNSDDTQLYQEVRAWAIANGNNPALRIAYCGYEDDFEWPAGWTKLNWKANGGYANQGDARRENKLREAVWFSLGCIVPQPDLFTWAEQQQAVGE